MKLAGMFFIGIILILAGMEGNLGSILGSIIDPANMVDMSGGSQTTSPSPTPLNQLLGGLPGG